MENGSEEIKDFFKFQIKRHHTNLAKDMFYILEDLLKQGCHFNYNHYRKRILDLTGDANRELVDIIDNKLNISLQKARKHENQESK